MLEQELKLHLPATVRQAVAKQLMQQSGPRRMRLRAMYFDTADRQLGRQRAALRLRQEGRRWVQTFKMAGDDGFSRLELNHPRPGPELDLGVYADTPAADVIAKLEGELIVRYETDVMRLTRQVRVRAGVVELACDTGVVRAGGLEVALHELELELVRGRPEALFVVAGRWQRSHGLVLDLRSKAERGDKLADAWLATEPDGPAKEEGEEDTEAAERRRQSAWRHYALPRRQAGIRSEPTDTAEQALRRITTECLEQIGRNGALITGNDGLPPSAEVLAEAVHQWRIGVRRLRSAWRLFRDLATLPPEPWRETIRHLFGALGAGRDMHVFEQNILPALLRAGMPPLSPAAEEAPAPAAEVLAGDDYRQWLLDMQAWAALPAGTPPVSPDDPGADPAAIPPPLAPTLARRLRKWHKKMVRQGRRFPRLNDSERHELRKLAKRVRYNLHFTESLWPSRRVKPYRKQLAVVQDLLGHINDDVTARDWLLERAETEPQAWFGVGWLAARLEPKHEMAAREFRKLAAMKPFWGKQR
ncbi:MAG: CYTH and CHAD domain-containing protein [Pigmentiphaga sp.]|nr:CYTH and CHAD domain-containing protein [Pigmentiphaga sp.]